jgi:hypothetical protein
MGAELGCGTAGQEDARLAPGALPELIDHPLPAAPTWRVDPARHQRIAGIGRKLLKVSDGTRRPAVPASSASSIRPNREGSARR